LLSNKRKTIPVSPVEDGFMTFTEHVFCQFFFEVPALQHQLKDFVGEFAKNLTKSSLTCDWLPGQEPGRLIGHLITDFTTEHLTSRQKGKAGHRTAIQLFSFQQIENQINELRKPTFDPRAYKGRGYLLRGSIKTDGHSLQLLGFKLKELQSVRYKRYKACLLPNRITSTTGGTDAFLKEIRNVDRTEDVRELWDCTPEDAGNFSYLGIDLGQTCVVGACAILPDDQQPKGRKRNNRG
ncbi:hypothetical protein BGW38_006918, partial [Lunasporangiospora selenospora]